MGVIPSLSLIRPFDETRRYSELAIVFLISYYLGMLVRYYPTHWNALVQGIMVIELLKTCYKINYLSQR